MLLDFGPHSGKSTQYVLLRFPDFVHWAQGQNASGKLALALKSFRQHAAVLDAKPLAVRCHRCKTPATRGSYHWGSTGSMWWCDDCDPYSEGALSGRLSFVRTYAQALNHVVATCESRRTDFRSIVKSLAEAKGAPKRMGDAQTVAFLA